MAETALNNSEECCELAQATITLRKRTDAAFAEIASLLCQLGIENDSFEIFGGTNNEAIERLKKRALQAL